jgi:hypothetical protein
MYLDDSLACHFINILSKYKYFLPRLERPSGPSFRDHILLDTLYLVGLLWTSDRPVAETSTSQHTQHSQQTNTHSPGVIQTSNSSQWTASGPRLRPRGYWDRHPNIYLTQVIGC